jgi:diketogulonate reductase-like aldo/keto reductase
VATKYILQKKGVGAAIVGARHARHLPDTLRLFSFRLSEEDMRAIETVTNQAQGPEGQIYGLERVKGGKHAAITKYDLNKPSEP